MTHGLNRQLVRRYLGPGLTLSASVPQPQVVALASALESRQLSAVRRYDILDTPPDGSFDRITAQAASLFSVPIAIISIVDHARIWFRSHHGQDVEQIDRAPEPCASAILHTSPWILTDAKHDVRSLANPLVAGEFGLRFHVGVPLRTTDGFNLGTLCVIDREPRPISERQNAQFEDLASVVMDQMELRLSARRAVSELSQVIVEKQAALQRSDMMKKEIDHRVMNSLQLASSLLAVQSHALGSSDAFEIAFVSILARRLKRLASDEVGAWRLRTASETRCEWIVLSNLYRKTCNEH